MKKNVIICAVLEILLFACGQVAVAKTVGYLVGTDGKATQINADMDTLGGTQNFPNAEGFIQSGKTSVVSDPVNNHLFAAAGRKGVKVLVFDLKTLSYVKDLGIYTMEPDITILVTPNGKKLFVIWWNSKLEGGAWQFDVFDGATLEKVKTLDFYFYPKQAFFSNDSSTLYAVEGGDEGKIKVINVATLKIASTVDLKTIWRTDVFTQGVEDFASEKILISETDKTQMTDLPKDTLFVYDLKTKSAFSRISTGVSGDEVLSSDGSKIIVNEKQNIWSDDKSYILYQKSMGKLRVYDAVTGKSIGTVPFTVDRESEILGMHPNGNKVYLVGEMQGNKSLIVIDMATMKVSKTLSISKNVLFMVFFNE